MSGAASTANPLEWYLARDGEQFGPLSEAELRKLVEFGHLRATDLLWREGFPDWRPARILLSEPTAAGGDAGLDPAPSSAAQATEPAPTSSDPSMPAAEVGHESLAQSPSSAPAPAAGRPAVTPTPEPSPAGAASPAAHEAAPSAALPERAAQPTAAKDPRIEAALTPRNAPAERADFGSTNGAAGAYGSYPTAHPHARQAPDLSQAYASPQLAASPQPHLNGPAFATLPAASPMDLSRTSPAAPVASSQKRPHAAPVHRETDDFDEDEEDDYDEEGSSFGRWVKRIAVLLFFTLTLSAAGWYAYPYRDRIAATLKLSSFGAAVTGGLTTPMTGFRSSGEATDTSLQKNDLWRVLKREFPDWYAGRVKEASAGIAAGKSEAEVARQMMEAVVALRRKHAGDALSATMPRLKALAVAFSANLVALRRVSVEACHTFIANGELANDYLRLMSDPSHAGALQSQLIAVFEAIADGRKVPRVYPQPKQTDYDQLVTVLEGYGWTEADMQLFSDSRSFGSAPAEKVCKMVTDWFRAQIELTDPDAQVRLLSDALKPVVAG